MGRIFLKDRDQKTGFSARVLSENTRQIVESAEFLLIAFLSYTWHL